MKRIKLIMIAVLSFSIIQVKASTTMKASSTQVEVGDNFTLKVTTSEVAAWNLHVTTKGPVEGCVINEADVSSNAENTKRTFVTNCIATGEGKIELTLSGDTTTENDKKMEASGYIPITVVKKGTLPPEAKQTSKYSDNANLRGLSVKKFKVTKVDESTYKVIVPTGTNKITINGDAEDPKATIEGTGTVKLEKGNNTLEIILTAEDGSQQSYFLKVVRGSTTSTKGAYSLLINSLFAFLLVFISFVCYKVLKKNKSSKKNNHTPNFEEKEQEDKEELKE